VHLFSRKKGTKEERRKEEKRKRKKIFLFSVLFFPFIFDEIKT